MVSNPFMRFGWRVAILVFYSSIAVAQVSGRFYLQKETYAPDEPVFLYFEVTNKGTKTQNIYNADPYSFCSGYQVRVSSDVKPGGSCPWGVAGSCLSSNRPLEPGKSYTERILLNYEHQVDKPGFYQVEAKRSLAYAATDEDFYGLSKSNAETQVQLHFDVNENASPDPESLTRWVAQLKSDDPKARREAARTLASLAPRSMEDLLLGFSENQELKQWAPLAFKRLSTPRSMAKAAELLGKSEPGSYEHVESAKFLAESGDPQWFPLLLEIAMKKPEIGNYVWVAAESGGEKAFPLLLELSSSPDTEYGPIGISGFGYTGSRAAIPILINLLKSSDQGVAQRALTGLRQLTHLQIGDEHWWENPQSQHAKWLRWWTDKGKDARVYKGSECGEVTQLP